MDYFKKPEYVPLRKTVKGNQGRQYNARLESSITSASPSSSFYSQQSICSGYGSALSLFTSVIDASNTTNESKILNNSTELHNSVRKFGQTAWLDFVNTTSEWQIGGFIEKRKEKKVWAVTSKGNLHKKMVTFERWWCVLTDEHQLCIQGFVENKNGMVQSEPIIKRMDSQTVASQNSLCKLKNFSAEDCVPGVPYYIKNKFASGFPEDWKLLRKEWIKFLQEGKHDFQWEANDVAASLDSSSTIQVPSRLSSQESNCVAYTDKIQMSNLAFSPVLAKNKLVQPVHGLGSNGVSAEKHFTLSTGRVPHAQEERNDCNIAKMNQPYCYHKQFSKNETQSKSTSSIQESSVNNVKDGFLRNMRFQDKQPVTHGKITTKVRDIQPDGYDWKLPAPTDTRCNVIGIDDVAVTRHKKFHIISDNSESETSSDADISFANKQINSQDVNKNDQHKKKKMQPVVALRKINIPQALPGNEILLENWLPILKGGKLYFEGYRSVGNGKKKLTKVSVKTRQKSDTVKLDNGIICKLVGHLSDVHNCLPPKIRSKFKSGMPKYWRKVLNEWVAIEEESSSRRRYRSDTPAEKMSSHLNNHQPENFRKSSRGRVLVEPLKHWLGETSSSITNHESDVSTRNKNNRQEELVDTQGSHAFAAEEILTSDKETRVTLNEPAPLSQKNVKNTVNSKRKKRSCYITAKKNKKEKISEPESVGAVNSDASGDNNCLDSQFQNPPNLTDPLWRNLRNRKKQVSVQKERSDAILNDNKINALDKSAVSQRTRSSDRINHEKLKHSTTNSDQQINVEKESSDAIRDENESGGIGKNVVSQRTHSSDGINHGKLKLGSAISNSDQQMNVEKESSDDILNENESDGVGEGVVSCRKHPSDRINHGKLKQCSTGSNTHPVSVKNAQCNSYMYQKLNKMHYKSENAHNTVPSLGRDEEDPTTTGNSKRKFKKTKTMNEVRRLEVCDMDIDYKDFLGKPPRTMKQRKKLDNAIRTLSQHNKNNMDLFSDTSESHENSRVAWDDFIGMNTVASFNIGEETPRSKLHNGIYAKTPDTSPSTSIFQMTPCNKDDILRYVHQQKTKVDKPVKNKDSKRTKLSFPHTLPVNQAVDVAYAALLRGESLPKHTISKETSGESSFSEFYD